MGKVIKFKPKTPIYEDHIYTDEEIATAYAELEEFYQWEEDQYYQEQNEQKKETCLSKLAKKIFLK
jgi:L-arabinose isomerase